jgi:hypothetical protein
LVIGLLGIGYWLLGIGYWLLEIELLVVGLLGYWELVIGCGHGLGYCHCYWSCNVFWA